MPSPAAEADIAVSVAVFSAVVVVDFAVAAVSLSAAKPVLTKVEVKINAPNDIVAINFFNFSPLECLV